MLERLQRVKKWLLGKEIISGFLLLRDLSQGSCPRGRREACSLGGNMQTLIFFCAIRAFAGRNTDLCGEREPSGDVRDVLGVLVELSSAGMSEPASILSICHILM